jgi:2-polyprenyl-6-methoxyphenol hydroxylase-like FAD-dependent oxidoreductase/predicted DsbA family dithiol-disulfide isomerase
MKAVIIGGGVAGLTIGRLMIMKGFDIMICERNTSSSALGHAFLMHTDGLNILKEINAHSLIPMPGHNIGMFSLKRPNGNEVKRMQLNSWQCIKRTSLISFLESLIPRDKIAEGRAFSHFIYEDEKIVAAAFLNGEVEYGDLFIGADGGNSKVRELIHGKVKFSPVEVKEVVGVSRNPELAKKFKNSFNKYQKNDIGLSFGMIPTGDEEFVWFMQYDTSLDDVPDASPDELRDFCMRKMSDFPPETRELLETNDFNYTYPWNTRDFDLLPSFHRKNVVLIGDAAHVALPFTSAGTTNAILDAKVVMDCLENTPDLESAFEKYYDLRSEAVNNHIVLGRELKKLFLDPPKDDDNIPVPLISIETNDEAFRKNKPIQVMYFTDPICSTCWRIQPILRKLLLEYGTYVNIEYRMGGLLPQWENFNRGGITKPDDVAKHWDEVCSFNEMPLEGDIWLDDPLDSSYPPSIAFKAAQLQSTELAILFLRRIKEMVFLEKKNIINWQFLESSAFEVGLDSARLLKDIGGVAKVLFAKDLELARDLNVTVFPTLFFSDKNGNHHTIKGYKSYEVFESTIATLLPDITKAKINSDPKYLFAHFNRMTTFEFAFITNTTKDSAQRLLEDLFRAGHLDKYESKAGVMWINNFRDQANVA